MELIHLEVLRSNRSKESLNINFINEQCDELDKLVIANITSNYLYLLPSEKNLYNTKKELCSFLGNGGNQIVVKKKILLREPMQENYLVIYHNLLLQISTLTRSKQIIDQQIRTEQRIKDIEETNATILNMTKSINTQFYQHDSVTITKLDTLLQRKGNSNLNYSPFLFSSKIFFMSKNSNNQTEWNIGILRKIDELNLWAGTDLLFITQNPNEENISNQFGLGANIGFMSPPFGNKKLPILIQPGLAVYLKDGSFQGGVKTSFSYLPSKRNFGFGISFSTYQTKIGANLLFRIE